MSTKESVQRGDALDTVLRAHARSVAFLRPVHAKWRTDAKLLRGLEYRLQRGQQRWRSDVRVPISRPYYDMLVSRFFQGMPAANAIGDTLASSLNADKLNDLLTRDQERMQLPKVINLFVKDGVEKGLGVFRDGWRTDTPDSVPHSGDVLKRRLAAAKKGDPSLKLKDVLYDGPEACWVDPYLVWWDPSSYDVDMGGWFGETAYLSDSELLRHPALDPARVREAIKGKTAIDENVRERLKALGYGARDVSSFTKDAKTGINEVLWYWGLFDVNGDGIDEECRIAVINRVAVACLEENPFNHGDRPYNVWPYDPEPGSLIGFSFMDRVRSAQAEYDDATDHFADNRKLTNNPVVKYRLGSDIDPEDLAMAPGLPLPVEDPDDVTYERMPDFGPSLQAYLESLREVMQLLTGANDVALGQQDVGIGDNTATGASIAQEQTEMRFKQPALMLDLAIERFGNHLISNEQQYRDSDEVVPVTDGDDVTYKSIAPTEIAGSFTYQMASGSLTQDSGVMRVNKLLKFKEIVAQNPTYDLAKIDDMIADAMGINAAAIKAVPPAPSGAAQTMAGLPPDAQQQAVQQMNLKPEDEALLTKLLANTQNGQPPPQAAGIPPAGPLGAPGMGAPGVPPA